MVYAIIHSSRVDLVVFDADCNHLIALRSIKQPGGELDGAERLLGAVGTDCVSDPAAGVLASQSKFVLNDENRAERIHRDVLDS